jgi:hypothetical protein
MNERSFRTTSKWIRVNIGMGNVAPYDIIQ